MDDIRLFGNDGDYLILEALDGQKFRLIADDSLKSAMKREEHSKLDAISLTPREIQDEIRNGKSIDDIVASSGAPYDFVEKFAAPVLDELGHMVASAKSVRISTSNDRYSESSHIEFGEVVESRLRGSGASEFVWSAKRGDFNSWIVSVAFELAGAASFAAWAFDPRKLLLSPENESAVNLSANDPLSTTPIPKLRPVLQVDEQPKKPDVPWVTQLIPVPEDSSPSQEPTERAVVALAPASEKIQEERPEAPLSATADLLQALRVKRSEREANPEPAEAQQPVSSIDLDSENKVQETSEAETPPAATSKKGRSPMPSWDQIVFGTKTDD